MVQDRDILTVED